tara:strand:- start:3329 stop:4000 length:672 start_codon:yes stop_codon:yes gene_type:complete
MQDQYASPHQSDSDVFSDDEPSEQDERSIWNHPVHWVKTHVPFKSIAVLIVGVCFADDMKNSYSDMRHFVGSKSSNMTQYIGDLFTKMSSPEMSNAITLKLPQAVSGSLLIMYGVISFILGSLALDKLKSFNMCSGDPKSPRKATRTPVTTKKTRRAYTIDEVEPVGEFEEALISHGFKKMKKRRRGSSKKLRITHRFMTPTQKELSGKKAVRQYLQNIADLP